MKSLGMVRKIDKVGRVVLPIELRESLYMDVGDSVEIYTDQDKVILKKHSPNCIFCGNADDVEYYKGKFVCNGCIEELNKKR